MGDVTDLLARVARTLSDVGQRRTTDVETLAPTFSPFEFVGMGELGLSRLLAWLLDPRGSHGQGGRFLGLLAAELSLDWDNGRCARARVRLEVATDFLLGDRRIDVLVEADGHALAIENKPLAADQSRQLADYLRHLDARYAQGGRTLVHVTPGGRAPSEVSIGAVERDARLASGELRLLSYPALRPWLVACRTACRAGRVTAFIGELERYVERGFQEVRDTVEQDRVSEGMEASPMSVAAALAVARSAEAMRVRLLRRLVVGRRGRPALRCMVLPQHPTRESLRNVRLRRDMLDAGPTAGGPRQFPEAASFSTSLSSVRSATALRSRPFYRSNTFSRHTASSCSPVQVSG